MDSGTTDMLMISPPNWRYIKLSALVEKAGPADDQYRLCVI